MSDREKASLYDPNARLEPSIESEKEAVNLADTYLDDEAFVNFLAKHPEAAEHMHEDAYIQKKAEVFSKLNSSKEIFGEFVAQQAGVEYRGAVDNAFIENLERYAAEKPDEFLTFSAKAAEFVDAKNAFHAALENKKKTHTEHKNNEEALQKMVADRSWMSYIPLLTERKRYFRETDELRRNIEMYRRSGDFNTEKLGKLKKSLDALRADIKGAELFEIVGAAVIEQSNKNIASAIEKDDHGALMKEKQMLEKIRRDENLLGTPGIESVLETLQKHALESMEISSEAVTSKKESVTLKSYLESVAGMRKRGIELGLSEKKCTEEIKAAFERKLKALAQSKDLQAKVKMLLIKRVISKLAT